VGEGLEIGPAEGDPLDHEPVEAAFDAPRERVEDSREREPGDLDGARGLARIDRSSRDRKMSGADN
jgi:hypothetical protein